MKLLVKSTYRNRDTFFKEGDVIEVSEAQAAFLRADAPGCFAEPKAVKIPPVDKMVKESIDK